MMMRAVFLGIITSLLWTVVAVAQTVPAFDPAYIPERPEGLPSAEEVRARALIDLLRMDTNPEVPVASEEVTITLTHMLTNLYAAQISWYVNGKLAQQGVGSTKLTMVAPAAGKRTDVAVSIRTSEGERIDKTLIIRPAGLEIVWEADSYVPPFYQGKALLPPEAAVKIVALPDFVTDGGMLISPANLVYDWKVNGRAPRDASGYGKNILSYVGPKPFGELLVEVKVSSVGGTLTGKKTATIPVGSPTILLYERKPLVGVVYEHALPASITPASDTMTLRAEPFFFSKSMRSQGRLSYNWIVNGASVDTENTEVEFDLRPQMEGGAGEEERGSATAGEIPRPRATELRVTLAIANPIHTFQLGSRSFAINLRELSINEVPSRP